MLKYIILFLGFFIGSHLLNSLNTFEQSWGILTVMFTMFTIYLVDNRENEKVREFVNRYLA